MVKAKLDVNNPLMESHRMPNAPIQNADTLFTVLAKLASATVSKRSGLTIRAKVVPQPSGTLRFSLISKDENWKAEIDWGDRHTIPDGPEVVGDTVRFAIIAADKDAARTALQGVGEVCLAALRDNRFAMLITANRNVKQLTLDSGAMDRILARRLSLGKSSVAGFVFAGAEENAKFTRYALRFVKNAGQAIRFEMAPPARLGVPQLWLAGPLTMGIVLEDGENARVVSDPKDDSLTKSDTADLITFVRFLLARSLHQSMTLSEEDSLPLQGEANVEPGSGGDTSEPDGKIVATWDFDADTTWRRFLCPYEIEHDATGSFYLLDRFIFIEHGELECNYVQVFGDGKVRQHKPIWPMRWQGDESDEQLIERASPNYYTYLSEEEVICGGSDRLEKLLEHLRENTNDNDLIFFNDTCIARILGEDMDMLLRNHQKKGGAPVLFPSKAYSAHTGMQGDLLEQALRLAIEQEGKAPYKKDEGSIALVGYPPDDSYNELLTLLNEIDLHVVASVIPRIGIEEIGRLLHAKTIVVSPFRGWKTIADLTFSQDGTNQITPPLPYGIDDTANWLTAIAEVSGLSNSDGIIEKKRRDANEHIAIWREAAHTCGLAFVVTHEEAQALADPERFFGIDALRFLEGLGFQLNVFLHDDGRSDSADVATILSARLTDPDSLNVSTFEDKNDLAKKLTDRDDIQAVWSQFSFDRRMYNAGKAAFSIVDFQKGFDGAEKTARRLITLSRWRGPRLMGSHIAAKGWPT